MSAQPETRKSHVEKGTTMSGTSAPCPVCHGKNLHVAECYDGDGSSAYRMVCDDCGYQDPDLFEEEYVAVDHWNRRVVKGYVEGDDPTDTMYDMLDDDDWVEKPSNSNVGDISWDMPSGRYDIREPKRRRIL